MSRTGPKLCYNPDCRHPADEHDPEWGCEHSFQVGEADAPSTPTGPGVYAAVCECETLEYPPEATA